MIIMRKNVFKPSKIRGIKRKKITTMAGVRYLAKADEMNREIDYINKNNAKAYDAAARCQVR